MTMITGTDIPKARLLVLRASLKLEIKGLHRRGRSTYSIVKEEFGFQGNRERVLEQLNEYIDSWTCPNCGKWMPEPEFRALSRKDNKTHICPPCGTKEALGAEL